MFIRSTIRRVSRVSIGVMLCLSAAMKVGKLSQPTHHTPEFTLLAFSSLVELIVGLVLILDILPSLSTLGSIFLFLLFAGANIAGIVHKVPSCNCFGSLSLSPQLMLIVDLSAIVLLLATAPRACLTLSRQDIVYTCVISCTCILLGVGVGLLLHAPMGEVVEADSSTAISSANTVIIKPFRMVGHLLAFSSYIDIGPELYHWYWKVIFIQPGCPDCEKYLKQGGCRPEGTERVALILVDSDGNAGWRPPLECNAKVGWLSRNKRWYFDVPTILMLRDGMVTEVKQVCQ